MKTKFILGSMVLTAAFAACSNEELATIESADVQSNMIELSENFMLGTVGSDNVESRTHWNLDNGVLKNVFAPIINSTDFNNQLGTYKVKAPAIGLCWIGQSLGTNVYTNYEFIHNGWLAKDVNEAEFAVCPPHELLNGWLYSEVNAPTSLLDGVELDTELSVSAKGESLEYNEINLNSGVYKTDNKSIFGGQYIAYYPYNKNFINAGTIPATSLVEFNDLVPGGMNSTLISDNTFRYTKVATIDGGAKAEGFEFKNLSSVLRIVLKNNVNSDAATDVEKIILYSPSASIKKEVRLSASAIAAGKTGADLYTETVETSKTILVNMATPATIMAKNTDAALVSGKSVFITALPQTISDLKLLAYDEDAEEWAEYSIGNVVIPAGGAVDIVATIKDADFQPVYYAVDQATLETALSEAASVATSAVPAKVRVLGDITITKNSIAVLDNVIVEGDDIYVAEGGVLQLWNATMKSNIIVEGQTCCGTAFNGGQLNVLNSTIDGDVTIEKGYTGKKAGSAYFMPGNNNVTKNSTIIANGNIYLAAGGITPETIVNIAGKLENNATITIYEDGVINTKGADIENNGTIEVLGEFNVLDATGATVAAAGEKFTNNGTFIDNVGSKVGGATQYMINNGDYICKVHEQVRLDEAYENKLACNIIEFVNVGGEDYDFYAVQKHNGKDVDLIVNAVVGFDPTVDVTLGNVEVKAGKSLFIHKSDLVYGSTTNYAEITINGNLNNSGAITVREDVRNLTAKNFTTNNGGSVTFENRVANSGKTMIVNGTIEVKDGGTFTINPKVATKNVALVTCKKLIEGGTFYGKPNVVK